MNFKQGDHVSHPRFGVGIIASIEEMSFTDSESRIFYRVDFTKTTVWVPVESQPKNRLRRVTPKDHLARYRSLLESLPIPLDSDFRRRQIELEERVDGGTFQGLCEIIRDLNALDAKKPLNHYEKRLYQQTREALVSEWSMTSGLSHAEAMSEIDGCLHKGSRSSVNV
jgi:RNA polymerase-interacting CarD/CdnL/TRCF family regulator